VKLHHRPSGNKPFSWQNPVSLTLPSVNSVGTVYLYRLGVQLSPERKKFKQAGRFSCRQTYRQGGNIFTEIAGKQSNTDRPKDIDRQVESEIEHLTLF
jgi:hypothetical protein